MGASIAVAANTHEEFTALQSEGAPEMHLSYGSVRALLDCFGLDELDAEFGRVQPELVLERQDRAREAAAGAEPSWVLTEDGGCWMNVLSERVDVLVEIAEAASRLRREVSWA